MSFPYNSGDGSGAGSSFPHWETLQHSPLDTPAPTPSSGTFRLDIDPMDLNLDDPSLGSQPQQQQPTADEFTPTIDNTPILLHHPSANPQIQQRHRPRAPSGTGTPSIHPIDALIFSRPGSSSSTHTGASPIHPMGMGQLIGHSQQFVSSSDPAGRSGSTPAPTPRPSSSQKTGAIRTSTRARTAAASSHPYLRQTQGHSSTSSSPFMHNIGIPSAPTPGPTIMTRSKARKQSVKFADAPTTAPTATGMEPMTHHGHGGMVERPATSSSGSATMQPLQETGATFFGTTVTTGSSQQHPSLPGTSSTSPPPQMTTSGGGVGQRTSPPRAPPQPSTSTHTSSATARPRTKIPSHRFATLAVHTDMSYSPQTHTLSCSLELPGVHPSHLRVSLGTCYFNHVKYVGVVGESVPVFGNESVLVGGLRGERSLEEEREEEAKRGLRAELVGGIRSGLRGSGGDEEGGGGHADHIKIGRIVNPNLRERKFGIFRRFIQVPSHTTPKDVAATLKHGVLTLHIHCGAPFEQDDEEEVPVAFD